MRDVTVCIQPVPFNKNLAAKRIWSARPNIPALRATRLIRYADDTTDAATNTTMAEAGGMAADPAAMPDVPTDAADWQLRCETETGRTLGVVKTI